MNTLRNSVNLIGHLGKDPVITNFGNDNLLARFSIAINESYKGKNGEWLNKTYWHNIVAWGKTAELCQKLLKKGSEVILEGKLVNNNYEAKDGEKRYNTEITLREFMLVDREAKSTKES